MYILYMYIYIIYVYIAKNSAQYVQKLLFRHYTYLLSMIIELIFTFICFTTSHSK